MLYERNREIRIGDDNNVQAGTKYYLATNRKSARTEVRSITSREGTERKTTGEHKSAKGRGIQDHGELKIRVLKIRGLALKKRGTLVPKKANKENLVQWCPG